MNEATHQPKLSIVVVVHDMAREAPRTLHSLSSAYQRHIAADDYEVIVLDNGSNPPLDAGVIHGLDGHFKLIRMDHAYPSPVFAVNRGLAEARGDVIGVVIDGARMVTPGLLHFALAGAALYPRAIVTTIGWHLGFDTQREAIKRGHDQQQEDELLAHIGWPQDGYRLFEIATLAESCANGWLVPMAESNALFLRREAWDELGGMDEAFDLPGGGLVNLDTLRRASELPGAETVVLLGEGSFHQMHGGIATNSPLDFVLQAGAQWNAQYEALRGRPFAAAATKCPTLLGTLPRPALLHFLRTALHPIPHRLVADAPLGRDFDQDLWSVAPPVVPADPVAAALVALAQREFRAGRMEACASVARLAREYAPTEPEPQRLLSLVGVWLTGKMPSSERRAHWHLALGEAHELLGAAAEATEAYHAALECDGDLVEAHVGLSRLRLPGDGYLTWLDRLHGWLEPLHYLEIGVAHGATLALARPPTCIIGIDPQPAIQYPLKTESHIYCETSDAFFARDRLPPLLGGTPLAMAFIDGLHVFRQSLRDFIHVEAHCGPRSLVMLHDTIPLDEITQRPERARSFYTGDVWKTVLCLRKYRPDLDVFTIATPWTGLTLINGLDPASRRLTERIDEAVAEFDRIDYDDVAGDLPALLNTVANDWSVVEARLRRRGLP